MKTRINGKRIWSKTRRTFRRLVTWVRSGWWWIAPVMPMGVCFWMLTVFTSKMPPGVGTVVMVGICLAGWSVAVLMLGIAIGAGLTWQKQEQMAPAVPLVQPQPQDPNELPDVTAPNVAADIAEYFAAHEDDNAPGLTADEEEEVPPPVTGFR